MAFIPRVQLPTRLAAVSAQLRAQLAEIIPRAITSVGESIGRGLEARGERKFKQRQAQAARTAGQEDLARRLTAQLGIAGQLAEPTVEQPGIGFSTGQLEKVLGVEPGFLGVDKPIIRKPVKVKEPEKPGAAEDIRLERAHKKTIRELDLKIKQAQVKKGRKAKEISAANLSGIFNAIQAAKRNAIPGEVKFAELSQREASVSALLARDIPGFDSLSKDIDKARGLVKTHGRETVIAAFKKDHPDITIEEVEKLFPEEDKPGVFEQVKSSVLGAFLKKK